MLIKYSPQRADKLINYDFEEEIISAIYSYTAQKEVLVVEEIEIDGEIQEIHKVQTITVEMEEVEIFDFTCFEEDGIAENIEIETLPFNPIISALREDGELKVELLYFYGKKPTHAELFPQWHNPLEEVEEIEDQVEE